MPVHLPLILLVLLAPGYVAAADKPLWTWHEPGTELYSPSFSTSGDELTLVRKRHTPDGHEAEELPVAELRKRLEEMDGNERHADPEVLILKIGTTVASRVDWGWSPALSPDGRQIVYAHQLKPISRFRVLAETLAGNDIRILHRDSKRLATLATPSSGYLADPIFAPDGKHVVYSLGDAVNGAWGGNVGIGRVSIDGTGNEILYPAVKEFGLFHLVDFKQYTGNRLVALRSKPTSAGTYIAESYLHELLDLGPPVKAIYRWAADTSIEWTGAFGSTADGQLLVYDRTWRQLGAEATSNPKTSTNGSPGVLSPDGRMLAVGAPSGIEIRDFRAHEPAETLAVKGHVHAVAWSPDSRRIAVLSTRYTDADEEVFAHDEIAVFGI